MTVIECDHCTIPFSVVECRWRCPRCGFKMSCCEGEACDPFKVESGVVEGSDLELDAARVADRSA